MPRAGCASGRATPALRRNQRERRVHHIRHAARRRGPFWTPIGGPFWTPIDSVRPSSTKCAGSLLQRSGAGVSNKRAERDILTVYSSDARAFEMIIDEAFEAIARDARIDLVAEIDRRAVGHSAASQPISSCFRQAAPSLSTFDPIWIGNLCLGARNLDDVHAILRMVHNAIGANTTALIQVGPSRHSPMLELLVDVPDSLAHAIRARRVADDPIMVACEQRVLGFAASDLGRLIDMNSRRRATLAIYAAHGVPEGYTVPLCVANEARAYCSFGFAHPDALTIDVMGILTMVAPMLFETARRVLGLAKDRRPEIELTRRQIECVSGIARGLSNAEIAVELGISIQTVHDHLESARKRYSARNRNDLMVQALHSGELHWSQMIPLAPSC